MKSFRVAVLVLVVVAVTLLGWFGYRVANAVDIHAYRGEFATLPATDDALRNWLAAQPGVTNVNVGREGRVVVIEFAIPTHGSYPCPEPEREAPLLGYGAMERYVGSCETRW